MCQSWIRSLQTLPWTTSSHWSGEKGRKGGRENGDKDQGKRAVIDYQDAVLMREEAQKVDRRPRILFWRAQNDQRRLPYLCEDGKQGIYDRGSALTRTDYLRMPRPTPNQIGHRKIAVAGAWQACSSVPRPRGRRANMRSVHACDSKVRPHSRRPLGSTPRIYYGSLYIYI